MKNELMSYEAFENYLVLSVEGRTLLSGLTVKCAEIEEKPKIGGDVRRMLRIQLEEQVIAPHFEIEQYYEYYQNGTVLDDIVQNIMEHPCFWEIRNDEFGIPNLSDFENVKEKIVCSLISNTNENQDYLENRVKIPMEHTSLAIMFSILVQHDEKEEHSIPITERLLEVWEVAPSTLYEIGKKNMEEKYKATYLSMDDMILDLEDMEHLRLENPQGTGMMVIRNTRHTEGAYAILYPEVEEKLRAHFDDEFYIIPSSRHEVIAIPQSEWDVEELYKMVCEINETIVESEDFLADDVYILNNQKLYSVRKNQ